MPGKANSGSSPCYNQRAAAAAKDQRGFGGGEDVGKGV